MNFSGIWMTPGRLSEDAKFDVFKERIVTGGGTGWVIIIIIFFED
jgi:hypothetical protein